MNEVQESLLGLLKEIDDICMKYGIDYYLGGGTLVGAIRHGGFLPWDDDADIHMSRENAEIFIHAIKCEDLKNRCVCIDAKDGTYGNVHWRYENTDSTALLRGNVGSSSHQGQFVDIFVNYPLPSNPDLAEKYLDNCELYVELKARNFTLSSILNRSEKYLGRYRRMRFLEKIFGKRNILKYLEKKTFYYNGKDTHNCFIRAPYPPKRVTPISLWGTPRRVKFESAELSVAEKSEELLCYEYGPTWFEIPQHVDRGEHTFVMDFEIPYDKYVDEYDKHINSRKFYNFEVKKKNYWFSLLKDRNIVNPHTHVLQGKRIVMEIQHNIQKNNIDLLEMLRKEKKKEISLLFTSYFTFLASNSVKYYGLYIDMPDELLYPALYYFCFDGNYSTAKKILNGRRKIEERPLTDQLKELCDICDATDELLTELYGNLDYDAAEKIVDVWLEKYSDLLYFMRAKLFLSIRKMEMEPVVLLKQCENYLKKYDKDGELLKYKGDILLKLGETEQAEGCYRMAMNTLRNGFCIKNIKEYFSEKEAV